MATYNHDLTTAPVTVISLVRAMQQLSLVWTLPSGYAYTLYSNYAVAVDNGGNTHNFYCKPGGSAANWTKIYVYQFYEEFYRKVSDPAVFSMRFASQGANMAFSTLTYSGSTSLLNSNPSNGTGRFASAPSNLVFTDTAGPTYKLQYSLIFRIKTNDWPGYTSPAPPYPAYVSTGYPSAFSYETRTYCDEWIYTAEQGYMLYAFTADEAPSHFCDPMVVQNRDETIELSFDGIVKDGAGHPVDWAGMNSVISTKLDALADLVQDSTFADLTPVVQDLVNGIVDVATPLQTMADMGPISPSIDEVARQLSLVESDMVIVDPVTGARDTLAMRTGGGGTGSGGGFKILAPNGDAVDIESALKKISEAGAGSGLMISQKLEAVRGFFALLKEAWKP